VTVGSASGARLAAAAQSVGRWLGSWAVLESLVMRREAGDDTATDGEHVNALALELAGSAEADGSWNGSVLVTSESLHLLADLGVAAVEAGRAGSTWLSARMTEAAEDAAGCRPELHVLGLCVHGRGGFIEAGPAEGRGFGRELSTGGQFGTARSACFGVSCHALGSVLRWGVGAPAERWVESLARVLPFLDPSSSPDVDLASYACAVSALATGESEAGRAAAADGARQLASLQRGDGSWPGVDVFHVLWALLGAAGSGAAAAGASIARAADLLASQLGADGSWGRQTGPARTLTGWRALRYAAARAGAGPAGEAR